MGGSGGNNGTSSSQSRRTPATIERISDDGYAVHIRLPSYDAVCGGSAGARSDCAASPQVLELEATHGNATSWEGESAFQWSCPPDCPSGPKEQQSSVARRRRRRLARQIDRRRGPAATKRQHNDASTRGTRLLRTLVSVPAASSNGNSSTTGGSFVLESDPATVAAVATVGGILYSEQCTTGRASPAFGGNGSNSSSAMIDSNDNATTTTITAATETGTAASTPKTTNETVSKANTTTGSAATALLANPYDTRLITCLDPALAASRCAFGEGRTCVSCPHNARCPGGRRAWPVAGFWASSENTSKIRSCAAPSVDRCRGMLHGSLAAFQCGPGYEGTDCARCKKEYYEESVTGRCLQCGGGGGDDGESGSVDSGGQHTVMSKAKDMAQKATPLFILLGVLVLVFLSIAVIVILIKRKAGGTNGAGFQRALHFIIYVVVLLQTTMFCSSVATREVVSGANDYFRTGAEGDAAWRAIAEAVGKFYTALNVFQLDFSDALQLPCLDVSQFVMDTVRLRGVEKGEKKGIFRSDTNEWHRQRDWQSGVRM